MKKKEISTRTEKNVGQNQGSRANSGKSYVLYDTCAKCPLWVYMDVVCDDNLLSLVVEGEPDRQTLSQARGRLLSELSEMMAEGSGPAENAMRDYHTNRLMVLGLGVCIDTLRDGNFKEAFAFLRTAGIMPVDTEDREAVESLIRRVEATMKLKKTHMDVALSKLNSLQEQQKGEKPTRESFYETLAVLSEDNHFDVNENITLAKYAAYIKKLQKKINRYGNNIRKPGINTAG